MSDDAHDQCQTCAKSICLRQTVINYALGNDEELFCLECLGNQTDTDATQVLTGVRDYILGRECFSKEWNKYRDRSFCPCPSSCIIDVCFGV